jgi:AraC-like DNA-binding protein
MKRIPVDKLQNKTSTGLQIKSFGPGDKQEHNAKTSEAHRDDHYIFFLLTNGSGTANVDSQDVFLTSGQLFYILPSQIHFQIETHQPEGWFLAIDTSLIQPDLRDVFEGRLNLQAPYVLTDYELKQYSSLLKLLQEEFMERKNEKFFLPIIHALVHSFLAMAASSYSSVISEDDKHNRAAEIARQFKGLLIEYSHSIKSPSAYAAKLNVSTGYLNEAIKKVTGSTVTYWIQQEVFCEAKRLLYHTDIDVKQIAYELGYTDYSYFIRTFRKACGLSPSKFRALRLNLVNKA